MILYSKKIVRFIHEIQRIIKEILSNEIHLRVSSTRFYDLRGEFSYPLKVVVYNHKKLLGYFDPQFYELGFHECLMHSTKEQLGNVIRHELAHYITFINYGETVPHHGMEFRTFCERMGWSKEVYEATACLETAQEDFQPIESSIFRKVQKLMALAGSSNKNEAEQAMIKSQQLLLKHNIDSKYLGADEEEKMVLKRLMKQKKENAKMRGIAHILETFFVTTVFHRAKDGIYLEILGSAVNVEIAEYVAVFLDRELEQLWNQAQQQANLKGLRAKNSFFLGLAKGYCHKIQNLKRAYNNEESNALMVIEKKLIDAKAMAYQRLSSSRSRANYCRESSTLGEQMGRKLNINPAINRSAPSPLTQLIENLRV